MDMLAKHWWMLVVRGVINVLFGILAIARPGATVAALVIVFGAYALADGMVSFGLAFAHRERPVEATSSAGSSASRRGSSRCATRAFRRSRSTR